MNAVAVAAGVFFALAMGLLVAFFVTGSRRADRWSERVFLVFFVLVAPVIYEIHRRYVEQSGLVWVATIVGLAAIGLLFVLELLVTTGRVEFGRVAPLQAGAFMAFVLWLLAASVFIVAFGGLSIALGWVGVAAAIVGLLIVGWLVRDRRLVRGERPPSAVENALTTVPFIVIVIWLIWLGLSL